MLGCYGVSHAPSDGQWKCQRCLQDDQSAIENSVSRWRPCTLMCALLPFKCAILSVKCYESQIWTPTRYWYHQYRKAISYFSWDCLFFFPHSIARYVDWVVVLWRGQQTAGIFNVPEDNNLSCLWSTTSLSLRCGVSLLHRDSFLFIKVRITNCLMSKHP